MVRFVRECGLLEPGWPEKNLLLTPETYGEWGKGPGADHRTPGVTVFIDNTLDCLWSMEFDAYGNAFEILEVSNDNANKSVRSVCHPRLNRLGMVNGRWPTILQCPRRY